MPDAPPPVVELRCPDCDSSDLELTEVLVGGCRSTFFLNGENREVEPHGYTEVYWDSSTSVGVFCKNCCWSHGDENEPDLDGALALLVPVKDDDDA